MAEHRVVVHILGEEYPISGVTDPAHITKAADVVDSRMREAEQKSPVRGRDKLAILAAMSLASELLDKASESEQLEAELGRKLDEMLDQLDHAWPALSNKQMSGS